MNNRKNNKGIVLAALLASFLGGVAGAGAFYGLAESDASTSPEALEVQDPKGPVNPAQQRAEMIRLLKSVDKHLGAIEKSLATSGKLPG